MRRTESDLIHDQVPDNRYPWIRFRLPPGMHLSFAFSDGVRRYMKMKSDGCCDGCGKRVGVHNLTASHLNHRKDLEKYNHPQNGRLFCDRCECEYHLAHVYVPAKIGMTKTKNIQTVYGQLCELSRDDAEELASIYPKEMMAVCRLLNIFLSDLLDRLE